VAPRPITITLLAGVYRAALGACDFALHLCGPTGVFKSELAALSQHHYGAGLDARHLPANWSSTANAVEGLAFAAKDVLLVVDDFSPTGRTADVQRSHREADRLLRAQGNHTGRQRMRADGTLRSEKPPRGLILSTGEDIPRGQSLRARLVIVEVSPGVVNPTILTVCQRQAAAGVYAQALSGFLQWVAPQYGMLHANLPSELAQVREELATGESDHARTPSNQANLLLGWRYFLNFSEELGALGALEAAGLWHEGLQALRETARTQLGHQQAAEPTSHYLRLLRAALSSGRAHLAKPDGSAPESSQAATGWRQDSVGLWLPQGSCIGWCDAEGLYLEPDAAYAAASELARAQGECLSVTLRTLNKRLQEAGLLLRTDESRKTATVRKTLCGQRRDVLQLRLDALLVSSD
jgi:hypothetical protein